MRVAKVFNNNVVLALDENGREAVLTGRGVGFQARPGQRIDPSRVARTFVPAEPGGESMGRLLSDIPPEHLTLRSCHPEAYRCAVKIRALLELRLGHPVNDSELSYLTIHVSRLASEN